MRVALRSLSLLYLALLLTVLDGCAKHSPDQVVPGSTTETALQTTLGAPGKIWTPAARPQARLLDYPDGCSFQVESQVVVGVACPPTAQESTLQYWRHRWAGNSQKFEELPGSANVHGQKRFRLVSRQVGMAVIYDEAADRVVRVVRYGAR